jgi:hypothetical protein
VGLFFIKYISIVDTISVDAKLLKEISNKKLIVTQIIFWNLKNKNIVIIIAK